MKIFDIIYTYTTIQKFIVSIFCYKLKKLFSKNVLN